MRRLLMLLFGPLALVLSALVLTAGPAAADSPHFLFANNSIDTSTGALNTAFKEAGLGTGTTSVGITLTADATATYQCWNKGGKHPQAGNKETVGGPVSNGGTFPVRNGQTTGSITVSPPGQGDFSCPNGQTLFLEDVSYTNIVLSGEGATADVPGTLTGTGLHIRV